jgi:hypothetical protein
MEGTTHAALCPSVHSAPFNPRTPWGSDCKRATSARLLEYAPGMDNPLQRTFPSRLHTYTIQASLVFSMENFFYHRLILHLFSIFRNPPACENRPFCTQYWGDSDITKKILKTFVFRIFSLVWVRRFELPAS